MAREREREEVREDADFEAIARGPVVGLWFGVVPSKVAVSKHVDHGFADGEFGEVVEGERGEEGEEIGFVRVRVLVEEALEDGGVGG